MGLSRNTNVQVLELVEFAMQTWCAGHLHEDSRLRYIYNGCSFIICISLVCSHFKSQGIPS
jgi:bacteriorhodopsin